ncbi:MAG TPA: citrate synthase family protein [Polyangiaceae bacterium]|nr:citrate synthase family protein [Polyangiaceae bacterium]
MKAPARSTPAKGLLSAREAAAFLDVKAATLYSYVSRGLLASVPGTRGPSRLYARADVERLRARHVARSGHGAVAAGALRFGEPVLESALTAIDERGHRYRGHSALELAAGGARLEAVAELLWTGELPASPADFPSVKRLPAVGRFVPRGAAPLAVLSLVVSALALADPFRFDAPPDAELARARRLVRLLASAVALAFDARRVTPSLREPSVAGALAVALGARPTARTRAALDRALVLSADHELNPSSFAARVAASTGADLYAALGAALGALSGPEHGGACARVEALVAEAGSPARAATVIEERTRRGDPLPGFGHPLYPKGDPRARMLLAQTAPRTRAARTLAALVQRMKTLRREPPTNDVALVATALSLGLPAGSASALFAVGRAAGWVAHVLEQRAAGFILRPRAEYVGR